MKIILAICFLLFLVAPAKANEHFLIDPVHTRIAFSISHAGFSNAIGTFAGSTGELVFDEEDWSKASVSVSIPINSLDLGDEKWQKKILDGTFFDTKQYPTATFISQRIEKLSDNTGIAHGELTLRGVPQPVSLNFQLNALKRHPLNFKRTIGFSASTTISRKAFGMDAWANLIGDEVKVTIELEATRSKAENTEEQNHADKK